MLAALCACSDDGQGEGAGGATTAATTTTTGGSGGAGAATGSGGATTTSSAAGGNSAGGASGSGGSGGAGPLIDSGARVSLGGQHTCAVKSDGTVWCWGANNGWQAGSTGVDKLVPQQVAGLSNASAVSMGYEFSCAYDGAVKCWGAGSSGQLGDGNGATSPSPVTALLTAPTGVAFPKHGHWHACAIETDKTVWCWGFDKDGALGLGTSSEVAHDTPEQVVQVAGAEQLALGEFHACALLTGGTAKCWGYSGWGELGNSNASGAEPTALEVTGLSGAKQLAAGQQFTCAVMADDSAACWGKGSAGQLGNGTMTFSTSPSPVSNLANVKQVACGFTHACAVQLDGAVWCWGNNDYGQLGDGSMTESSSPVPVAGMPPVVQVATGFYHSCAVTYGGATYCWGRNDRGQLGIDNNMADEPTAQLVSF
jgi:alpha-tubulin suppressor-like RCC1 family protein